MTYVKPHFGNLQKRAKALGFEITRMSTDEDARQIGHHEYVLTVAKASQRTKEHSRLYSLSGIRAMIELKESPDYPEVVRDACGNAVNPSDPDYKQARDEMRGKSVPVLKTSNHEPSLLAKESLKSLEAARIIAGTQVFGALDKAYARNSETIKDSFRQHIAQFIAMEAKPLIEFTESEQVSAVDYLPCKTDTHIVGRLVVISESDFMKAISILKQLAR